MKVGVRAIIQKQDKFLLVHHKDNLGEHFIFPGGGVETNESLEEAVQREAQEETNLTCQVSKCLFFRQTKFQNQYGLEFYFLCKIISGKESLGFDPEKDKQVLNKLTYVSLQQLKNINFHPSECLPYLDKINQIHTPINLGLKSI